MFLFGVLLFVCILSLSLRMGLIYIILKYSIYFFFIFVWCFYHFCVDKMRIACLMDYSEINYKINKIYCDNHGIDLIVSSEEKMSVILRELERGDYDYLIWMNSNSHFYVDSPSILDFILDHEVDKYFFLSGADSSRIFHGFFIVKNGMKSIELLNSCNGELDRLENFQSHVCILEYGVLVHFEEELCLKNPYHIYGHPFVVHYGCDRIQSVKNSRKYYNSLSCL